MESAPRSTVFARFWLLSGVAALAVAGLLALLLAAARTPSLAQITLLSELFHRALVAHVDLSVLAWFLSIACMFWSLEARRTGIVEKAAFISFVAGMALMALSPFDPHAEALMSNYIPVLTTPVFFLGLMLIACGVGLQLAHYGIHWQRPRGFQAYASFLAALVTLVALGAFVAAFPRMPQGLEVTQYYDLLFWAGGHVLQNTHVVLLILAWFLLARALRPNLCATPFLYSALGLAAAASLLAPLGFFYAANTVDYRRFFTLWVMSAGGMGPALACLWMFAHLSPPARRERALFTSLLMSLLLFAYGGVLGMVIHGQDVTIPAHYHGAIVGITLAFGGVAYLLLPRFGYRHVAGTRLACWQPVVYGVGQVLHISGLAWSGGYGVLRKDPGMLAPGFTAAKAAMGLMGLGGAIAVAGGLMFVIVVYKAVRTPPRQ